MQEQSIFIGALEMQDPAEREVYLDRVCASDPALRQRIEKLLQRHLQDDSVLNTGVDQAELLAAFANLEDAEAPTADYVDTSLSQPAKSLDALEQTTLPPAGNAGGSTPPATASLLTQPDVRTVSPAAKTGAHDDAQMPSIPGYELLGVLGRGGMGIVYKARQAGLNRLVALKMILSGGYADQGERARFVLEAEAVARLRHANIVQIHQIGEHDGNAYFSLEYCDGGSLAGLLGGTPVAAAAAARIVRLLAQAMQAAHDRNIIHRDLKPANILLQKDEGPTDEKRQGDSSGASFTLDRSSLFVPKIADFGLAKQLDAALAQTATGAVMGTPSYMAPEQASGESRTHGPAADIYALGAILYECLTGRPPFKAANHLETIMMVVGNEPVPPSQLNPKTPRDLETICLKCLQKDPKKRYATAVDLADDLSRFEKGEPIRARSVGRLERTWRWCRRNPVVALLTSAVFSTLVLGISVASSLAVWALREADKAQKETVRADDENRKLTQSVNSLQLALACASWKNGQVALANELLDEVAVPFRGSAWRFLKRQIAGGLFTMYGHRNLVAAVCFSPDGQSLASASFDHTVKLWDVRRGQELLTLMGHTQKVLSVCFSPDGRRLASASEDGTVKMWDVAGGPALFSVAGRAVCFSPDGQRLATSGGTGVIVRNAQSGAELFSVAANARDLCFSPDGKYLAAVSGNDNENVTVWDARGGPALFTLSPGFPLRVSSICFSPDGQRLAARSYHAGPHIDGALHVWDLGSRRQLVKLNLKVRSDSYLTNLNFSPDGRRLASVKDVDDTTVTIWDAGNGQELMNLRGLNSAVTSVCFSPDGQCLASASADGAVKIWSARGQQEIRKLSLYGFQFAEPTVGRLNSVAFSSDGQRLIAASSGNEAFSWDTRSGELLFSVVGMPIKPLDVGEDNEVLSACFNPAGDRLALGDSGGRLKICDAAGKDISTISTGGDCLFSVCFSPDGRRLASAGGKSANLWDADNGKKLLSCTGHAQTVQCVCFSPDGRRLATASRDQTVKIWDAATGQELKTLKAHTDDVYSVCFSPDGHRLASASIDHTVKIWDAATGQEIATLKGHTGGVWSVCFSPDGQRLASAGQDKTVRIWDARNGQPLVNLQGHTEIVSSVSFSPDGQRLASASHDQSVRIWDVRDTDVLDKAELSLREFATALDGGWHTEQARRHGGSFHLGWAVTAQPHRTDYWRLLHEACRKQHTESLEDAVKDKDRSPTQELFAWKHATDALIRVLRKHAGPAGGGDLKLPAPFEAPGLYLALALAHHRLGDTAKARQNIKLDQIGDDRVLRLFRQAVLRELDSPDAVKN